MLDMLTEQIYSYKEGSTKKDKNKRYYNYDWMSQHTYKRVADSDGNLSWKAIRRRRCSDWQASHNKGLSIITDY